MTNPKIALPTSINGGIMIYPDFKTFSFYTDKTYKPTTTFIEMVPFISFFILFVVIKSLFKKIFKKNKINMR